MHYFIVLTTKCNLDCLYCRASCEDDLDSETLWSDEAIEVLPSEIQYNISELKEFISKDDDPVLIFYGGEPLLRIDLMKEIMNNIPARYMLQTNGLLLRQLEETYLHKLENIMVSIDGKKAVTDHFRGKGVYEKVIGNLKWVKDRGFRGELLARMTVMEPMNINDEVNFLFS